VKSLENFNRVRASKAFKSFKLYTITNYKLQLQLQFYAHGCVAGDFTLVPGNLLLMMLVMMMMMMPPSMIMTMMMVSGIRWND